MQYTVQLGATDFAFMMQARNGSGTPGTADSTPAYKIYAPSGTTSLLSGSMAATEVDTQTGLYQKTSLSMTAGKGFAAGTTYLIRVTYAISGTNYVDVQSVKVT